jgi:enoyl-CoA hydratase
MIRVSWEPPSIMVITLDRPERRNAVDLPSLEAILAALDQARRPDDPARVIVLTGTPPAFCAGADLSGVENDVFVRALQSVLTGFTELPIPVIGAVDGPALGAGTQLASVCDLRVATSRSRFGIPAAKLGIAVDQWTANRVAQEFTPPIARAMLLAAETFDGERLHDAGVVHRIGGFDEAMNWAREVAALAPMTIATHKLALERNAPPPSRDPEVVATWHAAWESDDAAEGRTAFAEKRAPNFIGR